MSCFYIMFKNYLFKSLSLEYSVCKMTKKFLAGFFLLFLVLYWVLIYVLVLVYFLLSYSLPFFWLSTSFLLSCSYRKESNGFSLDVFVLYLHMVSFLLCFSFHVLFYLPFLSFLTLVCCFILKKKWLFVLSGQKKWGSGYFLSFSFSNTVSSFNLYLLLFFPRLSHSCSLPHVLIYFTNSSLLLPSIDIGTYGYFRFGSIFDHSFIR